MAGKHGGGREGAGRPPEAGEPRTELIRVRATPAEKAELLDLAGDQPLGTWLRELGLKQRRRQS